jgi:ketosteroid isomerase-like protein
MTRTDFERLIRELYESRLANDVDRCVASFARSAAFRFAGGSEANAVALAGRSPAEVRMLIAELVREWRWKSQEFISTIIDGNKAAVQYRVTTVHVPSGETVTTEVADVITAADGKVVEFVQFVDTATIAALAAQGAARGARK